MSEHTAKRQRLTGSFSPGSPPYHIAAKTTETKRPIVHPSTPTSPPYPSMNSQSNGGPATTATAAFSDMTPPSSVIMSQQPSQSGPSATHPVPFPTPASTAGPSHSMNVEGDGDAMMDESQDKEAGRLAGHRRSDHNRQTSSIFAPEGGVAAAKGVYGGQLFHTCQSTHTVSRPHGSQNLFELYGLNALARSVARNDPNTGEKINKLRKSYEGHIKALQIAGKAKAVKMEGILSQPMMMPDEEYHSLMVQGKEMRQALNVQETQLAPEFESLLSSAFESMGPGQLSTADAAKYKQYLVTDEMMKPKTGPEVALHRAPPSAAPTPNANTSTGGPHASRPARAGSKRQYTDTSFQGYGEGFVDDHYAGESTGGEDSSQNGIKKRRMNFERTSHQVEVGGVRR